MEAAQVKHIVSIKLADALFGDDAYTDGSFIVPSIMTFVTTVLGQVIKRQVDSIHEEAQELEEQWLGKRRRLVG
jgi:hypothetical protein